MNARTDTPHGVQVWEGSEALDEAAAAAVCYEAAQAIERRGRFLWVLSGGTTPRSLYRRLAVEPWRSRLDWSRVEFFWSDERAVPPDHPDSNYYMAREALLAPLRIEPRRIHRMPAERADLEQAAIEHAQEIQRVMGEAPRRRRESKTHPNQGDAERHGTAPFDLVLLGLGADGHTASLFPDTRALAPGERTVMCNEVPALGVRRLTLTAPRLSHAHAVFFLVRGAGKAAALAAVLGGPPNPQRYPAQLIRPRRGRLEWFVDAPAAAGIRSPRLRPEGRAP